MLAVRPSLQSLGENQLLRLLQLLETSCQWCSIYKSLSDSDLGFIITLPPLTLILLLLFFLSFEDNWRGLSFFILLRWVLVATSGIFLPLFRIFHCSVQILNCGMQAQGRAASGAVICGLLCSEACGILVPQPRIKPAFPALTGRFLITRPPGKPLFLKQGQLQLHWPQDNLISRP